MNLEDDDVPPPLPLEVSPDIIAAPRLNARQQFMISEAHCERAAFVWEIHEDTYPLPVIPSMYVINPLEPERDSSKSVVDLMDSVPSGRFIRGQEINKPAEWQLYLQNSINIDAAEIELHLVLKCEKIYIKSSVHTLAKVACEIIDDEGGSLWSSGDVYESEVRQLFEGNSHAISLGTKSDLQERRNELIKNGVLRFRLRLNIYKDLTPPGELFNNNNQENDKPPKKKRRIESGVSSGLTDLLSSLENLWHNRQQTGDIIILCGGSEPVEVKAHRFILSGRSKVFMEMLDSKMETTEKSTSVIKVDDIHPEIMTAMLEFLYLNDKTSSFDWENIDHVCALIYAADKYWITPLMVKCYQTLMGKMNLENFAKIVKVTFMYNCVKQFKEAVRHFYESNQITLNEVESFREFIHEDYDHFLKLFFYIP